MRIRNTADVVGLTPSDAFVPPTTHLDGPEGTAVADYKGKITLGTTPRYPLAELLDFADRGVRATFSALQEAGILYWDPSAENWIVTADNGSRYSHEALSRAIEKKL